MLLREGEGLRVEVRERRTGLYRSWCCTAGARKGSSSSEKAWTTRFEMRDRLCCRAVCRVTNIVYERWRNEWERLSERCITKNRTRNDASGRQIKREDEDRGLSRGRGLNGNELQARSE